MTDDKQTELETLRAQHTALTESFNLEQAATPLCKGDWLLGTACGQCKQCLINAPAAIKRLQFELRMYQDAWLRELGGKVYQKNHLIDSLVVTTRRMREELFALKEKQRMEQLNAALAVRDECEKAWRRAAALELTKGEQSCD